MNWGIVYCIGMLVYYAVAWVFVARKYEITIWETFKDDKCTWALSANVFLSVIWGVVVPVVIFAVCLDWQIKKIKKEE